MGINQTENLGKIISEETSSDKFTRQIQQSIPECKKIKMPSLRLFPRLQISSG